MATLNFGVNAGNSTQFVSMFGMATNVLYTMSTDNQKMEVAWAERDDADIVTQIADYKKHFIRIGDELSTFVTPYDAALYLADNLKSVQGLVKVTGTVEKEPYINKAGEKKFVDTYNVTNVTELKADENGNYPESPGLRVSMELFYTKDSVDTSDYKTDKIVTVDGYIKQYVKNSKSVVKAIGEANKEYFMPQKVVLSMADFKDKEGIFKVAADELKVASDKKLYHLKWECKLVSGPEEVEFDESQLTPKQRALVEVGAKAVLDFAPKGRINGEKIRELRLILPDFTGEFVDGVVESETTLKEFEEEKVKFLTAENFETVVETAKSSKEDVKAEDDELPFDLDDSDNIEDIFND